MVYKNQYISPFSKGRNICVFLNKYMRPLRWIDLVIDLYSNFFPLINGATMYWRPIFYPHQNRKMNRKNRIFYFTPGLENAYNYQIFFIKYIYYYNFSTLKLKTRFFRFTKGKIVFLVLINMIFLIWVLSL